MRLNTMLLITFIVAGLFGLGFLFLPAQMLTFYGMQTDAVGLWLARFFGVSLLGFAVVAWFLRSVPDGAYDRPIALGFFVYETLGTLVALWGVFSPEGTPMLWLSVAVYGLLALGYLWVLMRRPAGSPLAPAA